MKTKNILKTIFFSIMLIPLLYIWISVIAYQIRNPDMTKTRIMLNFDKALLWK